MAMCKELLDIGEHDTDLTICGICEAPIEDPRALPCLHTFCLGCIEEWAKGKSVSKITCPLCKEDFAIPSEGVSGFRSNFFVTNLKKTRAMKDKVVERKITSNCCANTESAVARCLNCKHYLCTSCVQIHKTLKHFENHQMFSFDDIRSGKVDVHHIHVEEFCTKHKGQVLWFYCETCGILICRDCTVVDHPAASHTLVNVEEVSGEQSKYMEELASQCRKVAEQVDDAIKIAHDAESSSHNDLQKANEDLDLMKSEMIEYFNQKIQTHKDQIARVGDDQRAKINLEKRKLQTQRSQLSRALDMADTVTRKGSPYDLAAIYTTLTDTMQKLSGLKPANLSSLGVAKIVYTPNTAFQMEFPEFGTLTVPAAKHDLSGEWEMTKRICTDGKLKSAVCMAFNSSGDFAVACSQTKDVVRVYNPDGIFKHDIDTSQAHTPSSTPQNIAISSDNFVYITDMTPYVKVFDANAKQINKFPSVYPPVSAGPIRFAMSLYGLTIDHKDQILVGDIDNDYISIHKLSGTHVSTFNVSIKPHDISNIPRDNTIIVSHFLTNTAQILDYTGQVLHNLVRPTGLHLAWQPTGMCLNGDNDFLIASQARHSYKKAGIHHYTTDGDYLGCITMEVDNPTNVVITRDGKLLVLEWTSVKVFTKK